MRPRDLIAQKQYVPIIEIAEGYKQLNMCHRRRHILTNINLKVFPREIYVLLGPSGSGKSTVVNVILGFTKLSRGDVQVFGFKPGHKLCGPRLSYIPQSLGICKKFTVEEILRYYGVLLGLNKKYVTSRIAFLADLLELPIGKTHIQGYPSNLQRQISFAIALLHEPDLLVLDDSASGIDPVLRKRFPSFYRKLPSYASFFSIFEYLRYIARTDEKTIFITSTDCLDGLEADRIGIIKEGCLMVEEAPKFTSDRLQKIETLYMLEYPQVAGYSVAQKMSVAETSRIKLLQMESTSSEGFIYVANEQDSRASSTKRKCECNCFSKIAHCLRKHFQFCSPSASKIRAIINRSFVICFRSYCYSIPFVLLPILFTILFGNTLGTTPHNLLVGLVNHEAPVEECTHYFSLYTSCHILNFIDSKRIVWKKFRQDSIALAAVRDSETHGALIVGKDFTDRVATDNYVNNSDISAMTLYLDETDTLIATSIKSEIMSALTRFKEEIKRINKTFSPFPMELGEPIFGTTHSDSMHYLAPGLALTMTYYLSALVVACSIIEHKTTEIYRRDYLAGTKLLEIVIARIALYGTVVFFETFLVFTVMVLVNKVPLVGSILHLIPPVLLVILCGISLGVLLAIVFSSNIQMVCCILCLFVFTMMMEGVVWPSVSVPLAVQNFLEFLPINRAANTVRLVMLRGTKLELNVEILGLVVPSVWTVVYLSAAFIINTY